ncbi:unnamed protein product [Calicophoron daubneyi]|uniref:Uncharacterized protein n=1 Tax=Calicophoron daubneyi TaxID=300641 RepID=A0AAV2T6J7_CALDB
MSSESSEKSSPKRWEHSLDRLPTMIFDKYLITAFSESPINKDRRRIEIPIHFGVPMILLREKHEQELNAGKSFIESEPPPKQLIDATADRLMINCNTKEDIEVVLGRAKPILIFHTILEMLRRFPEPIFPLSYKSAQVISKVMLLEPLHPYDFLISEDLYKEILRVHAEQGDDNAARFKRSKHRSEDTIQPLIQKYYNCNRVSKNKQIRMYNKFSKCIYHDLHLIQTTLQRNLVRFIIRNTIFIARSYNIHSFSRLSQQRAESWQVAAVTIRPHIIEYSYTKLADLLGPVLMSQPVSPECFPDVEKRAMLNILASDMDRMWLPGQKPQDVTVNMEPTYCHANCVCGRGLNVISADSGY